MTDTKYEKTLLSLIEDPTLLALVKSEAAGTGQSLAEFVKLALLAKALKGRQRIVAPVSAKAAVDKFQQDAKPNAALTQAFHEFGEA